MPTQADKFLAVGSAVPSSQAVAFLSGSEPVGDMTKLGHGMLAAWPRAGSDLLGGLAQVAPEGSGPHVTLTRLADLLATKVNPQYEQQGAELTAGSLTDPMTHIANAANALPMIAKYVGAQLGGAAIGAATTKNPWGAVVGGAAAPFALGGLEGKYQKEKQLRELGIDADIADSMANAYGLASGGMMAGVTHIVVGGVSKRIIRELSSTGLAAVEMGGLTALDNLINESAVNKMKAKHGKEWEPKASLEKQDPIRSAVLGATMVGAVKAVSIPHAINKERKARNAQIIADGKDVLVELDNNAPIIKTDEYFNPYVQESKYREYRKTITAGATPERLELLANTVEAAAVEGDRSQALRYANTINKKLKTGVVHTGATPLTTLMADIRSHLGLINEGPQWGVGEGGQRIVVTTKPLHEATEYDVMWHGRVRAVAKSAVEMGMDTKPLQEAAAQAEVARLDAHKATFAPELQGPALDARIEADKVVAVEAARIKADADAKSAVLWDMRRRSLIAAGLPEDMAVHPGINPKPDVSGKLLDQHLPSRLTRDQLARYDDSMEGQARQLVKGKISNAAYNTLDATLFQGYKFPKVLDPKTKRPLFGILPEDLPSSGLAQVVRGAPYRYLLNKISVATKWPLERLCSALDTLAGQRDLHLSAIGAAQRAITANYPKEWTRGVQRRDLIDLQHFIGQDARSKEELKNQWSMSGMSDREVQMELAGRVLKNGKLGGGIHTTDNIITKAAEASTKVDIIYRWYARNGVMDPKLFSEHYRPLVYEFEKTGNTGEKGEFADYVQSKREYFKNNRKLTDDQIDQMVNFGDTLRSLERKGFTVVGKNPMFAEYLRSQDREFRKQLTAITDDRYLLDMYSRQAANRIFFEDIAPTVAGLINRIEREMGEVNATPQQHAVVKQIVHDWLKSMMGVPEMETQAMRKGDIRAAKKGGLNILYGSSKLLDYGLKLMNRSLGRYHDFSGPISPDRAVNDLISATYARYLGVHKPITAFVQNFASQLPLATMFGTKSLMKGAIRYQSDKAFAAEIDKLKLGTDVEERMYMGQRGHERDVVSSVTDGFMSGMMWSDTKLRRWAASAGLVNWQNMEKLLKQKGDTMTERDMEPILFAGKAPKFMKLSDVEIAKNGPTLEEKYRVSDKRRMHGAVASDIYGMIQEGKMGQARDLYIRYVSEVSQWRYGRGGSSMLHRTPMKRLFFMFMQYPQNYLALQHMLYSNRMFGTMMKVTAAQLVAAGLFSAMGLKVGRWVAAGPLPNTVAFTGPIVSDVTDVIKFLHAGAQESTSQLIPTMSQEEESMVDKAWDTELKKMESQFDF